MATKNVCKYSLLNCISVYRHGDKTIPELLTTLVCRDKPLPVAMGAARCLTFMHRAGALPADDNRYAQNVDFNNQLDGTKNNDEIYIAHEIQK